MNVLNTMNMKVTIDHNKKGHSQCKLLLPGKVQVDVWTIPKHLKVYPAGRGHALSNNIFLFIIIIITCKGRTASAQWPRPARRSIAVPGRGCCPHCSCGRLRF